jgi:antitoxin HigA-1
MTRKTPKRGLLPMHPGELLREEILPALARPKTEIAKLLGVSRQTLYHIIDEKQPVTATMALRLGKLCGNGPDLWLNLQKRYDLHRAEQQLGTRSGPSRHWTSPDETSPGPHSPASLASHIFNAAKLKVSGSRRSHWTDGGACCCERGRCASEGSWR